MINGILNIKKEKNFTSHDVVAKLRGILHQKKIGHTGTLDPDATGVLPVCLGKATKLCDMIGDWDKTYQAVLLLGKTTDTEDITGTVLTEQMVTVQEEEIKKIIQSFVGEYPQIPPMYSAKKIKGKKLYELAREGITVERKPCLVFIHAIQIEEVNLPFVKFTVHCSKGTYIRSLCRDIGEKAGCGGCMSALSRVQVASFSVEDAITLSEVQKLRDAGTLEQKIVPIDTVFSAYPSLMVSQKEEKKLYNGNPVPWEACQPLEKEGIQKRTAMAETYRVYDKDKHFIGVYTKDTESNMLQPHKLFFDLP